MMMIALFSSTVQQVNSSLGIEPKEIVIYPGICNSHMLQVKCNKLLQTTSGPLITSPPNPSPAHLLLLLPTQADSNIQAIPKHFPPLSLPTMHQALIPLAFTHSTSFMPLSSASTYRPIIQVSVSLTLPLNLFPVPGHLYLSLLGTVSFHQFS